jgi:enamine deaminase RidA (YjgF/YER057c/UK114 family)
VDHSRLPADSPGAYSDAVVAGDHCYVSGQLPVDFATGTVLGATVAEQTAVVVRRLFAVLERAGFAPGDLVSVVALLADPDAWPAFNEAYRELVEPHGLPARLAYAVPALHYGALVELQATAVRRPGPTR